jgi:hypothetical protein
VEVDPTGTLSPPLHPEVFTTLAPLPEFMTVEPLINVHKQRLIAGVVRDVVSGQHMARKYNYTLDRRLQRECFRLRALDNVSSLSDFNLHLSSPSLEHLASALRERATALMISFRLCNDISFGQWRIEEGTSKGPVRV